MGTSSAFSARAIALRDHPHACGDKLYNFSCHRLQMGSSPRVWGQGSQTVALNGTARIIPTRVGTSFIRQYLPFRTWDHPHACGDKCGLSLSKSQELDHPHACGDKKLTPSLVICFKGSSPRVWGQAVSSEASTSSDGIIPTRVGTRDNITVIKFAD